MKVEFDYKTLKKAIQRNPQMVLKETKTFLYKAEKRLESKAGSSPWRIGGSGGGVPVDTGNLLRSHKSIFQPFKLTYYQDDTKADYGKEVHRRRPWLEWTSEKATPLINKDAKDLLKNIVNDLGKK